MFEFGRPPRRRIDRLSLTLLPRVTLHLYGVRVKSPTPFPSVDVVRAGQADAVVDA